VPERDRLQGQTLDRQLRANSFVCSRCTLLTQCESCFALSRAFDAAPVGWTTDEWVAWACTRPIEPEPKRLLVALARRVTDWGYVQDSLAHFGSDAGLPRYEPGSAAWDEARFVDDETSRARWTWARLRELIAARLVEVDVQDLALPTGVVWVVLRPNVDADRVWRQSFGALAV
jgi:hypothetical protein